MADETPVTNPTPDEHIAAQFNKAQQAAAPAHDEHDQLPSAFGLFAPSWAALQFNLRTFAALYFGVIGVFGLAGGLVLLVTLAHITALTVAAAILFGLPAFVFSVICQAALVDLRLKSVARQKTSFRQELVVGKKFAFRVLCLGICVGFAVLIGLILLIVPGIIMLRRYYLANYVLVDQDLGVQAALDRSAELSRGHTMAILGVIGVTILLSVPQFIPYIGGLISFALTLMYYYAPAIRYQQLKALPKNTT